MKTGDSKKPHLHPLCINFGSGTVLRPLCLCHAALPLPCTSNRGAEDGVQQETCVDSCLIAQKLQTLEVNVIAERWKTMRYLFIPVLHLLQVQKPK